MMDELGHKTFGTNDPILDLSKFPRTDPTNPPPPIVAKKQRLNVMFTTHTDNHSGTSADVSLVIYGSQGTSVPYTFKGTKEGFKKGCTDMRALTITPPVGKIKSIRVAHNNKGADPEWYLKAVEIVDLDTGERTQFNKSIWLGKHDRNAPLSEELKPSK